MRKAGAWFVVVAAVAGAALSGIALDHFYTLLKGGLEQPSFCNISADFNCDLVAASSYATLFGQPIAGFGLCYFLVQLCFGGWAVTGGAGGDRRPTAAMGVLLGVAAIPYPAYLVFVMASRLGTFCLTCLGMDAALLLVAFGWIVACKGPVSARTASGKGPREGWRNALLRQAGPHAGFAAVLTGVGAIFIASATQGAYDALKMRPPSAARVADAVAGYQRGSLFDLPALPADHPVWGNPDAAVTIVEFSDFQCPYCKEAAFLLKAALAEYRDQVRFAFLHYPLDASCNAQIEQGAGHRFACLAARAARCAQQLGDFWLYHDDLFRHQEALSRETVLHVAAEQGLDAARFTQCLDDPATDAFVKADIALGHHVHVEGTPTILINNRQLHAWRSREVLRAIIRSVE